ncbi:MAG TPA: gas vesicle protein GvpD [Anaerolineae bacterium]|nr:gas vesicle protein GvpD [Anaerolineae bacterium]
MAAERKNIEWIDVGIEGLQDFIPGLPKGDAILVRGEPGTGKTILCLQFLHKGAENGEKCVYITTEETPETVLRTGTELWSDFPKLIQSGQVQIINLSITATYASEYSLVDKAEALDIVMAGLKSQPGATRIVIDSLSSLGRRLEDERDFRELFMRLLLETKKLGATTLLTAEGIPNSPDITEYLADHLIYLDYHKHDVIWTRVFILRKSRSVPLKPQILKLNIERDGLSVEEIPIALKPVWFASKI